jgi:hypothetical protein
VNDVAPLEGQPTDDQKHRLEDWLAELKIICRRHRILLDTDQGEARLVDLVRGTTIGIGVTYLTAERAGRVRITGYDCTGSILDGVWLVDTPSGPREQRDVGRVWPQHLSRESPS